MVKKHILTSVKTEMIKYLYNIGIFCYKQLLTLAAFRNPKARLLIRGQREITSHLKKNIVPGNQYVWFHASSLGEFEQGRPLIEALRTARPEQKIILTFFSPSGYEIRKNYTEVDVVSYLPFDQPHAVRSFLDLVRPQTAIFIKYEFWANYLQELNKRQIPTYIVSAIFRPTQLFFKPYGGFYRSLLGYFTHLFVQDKQSDRLLTGIGLSPEQITVCGDTRLDRVIHIARHIRPLPLVEQFTSDRIVLVAGSTWPEDETFLLDYFNRHPEIKLIIAPHQVDESRIKGITAQLKRSYIRYTQADSNININNADCLIIDCYGILSAVYQYGEFAYIGGGFGTGIHNVPEAAVYGIPVIFGPKYQKFKEAHDLLASGGAISIDQSNAFETAMDLLLKDKQARQERGNIAGNYIRQNAGATRTIIQQIFGIDIQP